MMGFAKMTQQIALIREKTLIKFNAYWKPLLDLHRTGKEMGLMIRIVEKMSYIITIKSVL